MNKRILSSGLLIALVMGPLCGCAGKELRSPIGVPSPAVEKEPVSEPPGSTTVAAAPAAAKEAAPAAQAAPAPTSSPSPPDTVVFSASFGPVTFRHAKHQAFAPQQCATCHYQTTQGAAHACRTCHKRFFETQEGDPPPFSEVKMNLCRGCHARRREEDQASKAPVACEGCHDVRAGTGTNEQHSPSDLTP